MSNHNTKVFFMDGGDELVVSAGGKLTVKDGATVVGLGSPSVAASASALGGVKAAARVVSTDTVECKIDATTKKLYVPTYPVAAVMTTPNADADAAAVRTALISLIASLKTAGIMASGD